MISGSTGPRAYFIDLYIDAILGMRGTGMGK